MPPFIARSFAAVQRNGSPLVAEMAKKYAGYERKE
jgi:hypothetical protein